MKKRLIYCIILFVLISGVKLNAQNTTKGIITYTASLWSQKQIKIDSLQTSVAVKNALKNLLNNKNTIDCQLFFNKTRSLFKKIEKLEKSKKNILLSAYLGGGDFFFDKEKDVCINVTNTYGEDFLIYYPKNKWKITNEKKKINGYLCLKAQTFIKNPKTQKKQTIIAWFTSDLPINYGPVNYFNLPGLILELEYPGKYFLRVKKIQLNTNKELKIDFPTKGKKIKLNEYEKGLKVIFENRKK